MTSGKSIVFLVFGILAAASFLFWGGSRIVEDYQYEVAIGGHLKRAADANTVPIAIQEMRVVIHELEARGYTHGCTCIIFNYPSNDVGFWYQNLKSALTELENLPSDSSTLEKSNALMKLRETILDGPEITQPMGISIYPSNTIYAIWALLSLVLMIVFFVCAAATWDDYY